MLVHYRSCSKVKVTGQSLRLQDDKKCLFFACGWSTDGQRICSCLRVVSAKVVGAISSEDFVVEFYNACNDAV